MKLKRTRKDKIISFYRNSLGPTVGLRLLRRVVVAHARHCVEEGFTWAHHAEKLAINGSFKDLWIYADALGKQQYQTPREHFLVHQLFSIFKKYPFPPKLLGFDPEATAMRTFIRMENRCRRMNSIIGGSLSGKFGIKERNNLIERMRSTFSYVLGELDLTSVYENCDFGSGSSLGVHGSSTHIGRKIEGEWTVTRLAVPYALGSLRSNFQLTHSFAAREGITDDSSYRAWLISKMSVVDYNKIAFVPKTAKTHRSIAVEANLNTFVQKGVDKLMRIQLRRWGIDLSKQSVNCDMAREGSENSEDDSSFCTIDLSSASDTMCIELVRAVLPKDWFDVLNSLRSHCYRYRNESIRYHKFCSMGNGFNFPLQTLLFASICSSLNCGRPGIDFRVYGDDIIVRKSQYDRVLRALRLLGFIPNKKKSFGSGPFRESCGEDWHTGVLVRPYAIDFDLGSPRNWVKLHNLMLRNEMTSKYSLEIRSELKERVPLVLRLETLNKESIDGAFYCPTFDSITSPYLRFCAKKQCYIWYELGDRPALDRAFAQSWGGRETPVWMYQALRGGTSSSHHDVPDLPVRRKTKVRLALKCGIGAHSTWVPPSTRIPYSGLSLRTL